jgi:hypothetical protein
MQSGHGNYGKLRLIGQDWSGLTTCEMSTSINPLNRARPFRKMPKTSDVQAGYFLYQYFGDT